MLESSSTLFSICLMIPPTFKYAHQLVHIILNFNMLFPAGMKQLGCYNDGINRDLSGPHTRLDRQNTPEVCVDFCLAKGRY